LDRIQTHQYGEGGSRKKRGERIWWEGDKRERNKMQGGGKGRGGAGGPGGGERRGEDRGVKRERSEGEMWEEGKERWRRGEGKACMWKGEGGES